MDQPDQNINNTLLKITEKINAGITLEEILNYTYESFRPVIPYDRIGFSLLEEDRGYVRSVWARSDVPVIKLGKGYSAPLAGSSLELIMENGQPRILNDLEDYLRQHPRSDSTRRIVDEGMRSSLTCPLWALGRPVGFLFFSSLRTQTYQNVHVDLFLRIAGHLSLIAEKSRLYQKLMELNDLKNKFLGIAAHDLRSPLTVIKGNLDLIYDNLLGETTPQQREAIEKMVEYCAAMLALINDLLDVSAIESGVIELRKKEVGIPELLHKSLSMHHFLAQAKNIRLETDINPDSPRILLDPDRISQVINNLVSNAIKFSPSGTVIKIQAVVTSQELKISVADQGQGIPEKEMGKIFHYFGKTDVQPTAGETSTGLGLAIAKKMIEAHGGTIGVESRVDQGSVFTFSLPLQ